MLLWFSTLRAHELFQGGRLVGLSLVAVANTLRRRRSICVARSRDTRQTDRYVSFDIRLYETEHRA